MAKRKRRSKKLWLYALGALAVVSVFVAVGLVALDHEVVKKFEGRRWTLPAQVYAQPLDLYVGETLSLANLEQELRRLGYRQASTLQSPGTYQKQGTRIQLLSRKFQFADEQRDTRSISVSASATVITALADDKGKDVPVFRLDPLLIGSIFPSHGEDRVVTAPEDVPPLLPTALKAVEDRHFDTHHGIDFEAIARAAWVDLRAGHIEQGGSTLTQQLVKSYFLDDRQTFGRKIKEALMAVMLDRHFEKADLMNAYINEIYLGQDGQRAIHGFGLASQYYFGKPLSELELHEIATLVALARGPSYYDPRVHADRALARRNLVLTLLAQFKLVPQQAAKDAMAKPLGIVGKTRAGSSYYPAFLDFVRRTLRRDYHEQDLTESGLKVFTTLDPLIQTKAEAALTNELDRLDKTRKRKDATLQGVVILTTPQSGDVSAMVGGRRVNFDGFNRALDAKRSIGSLVKPFVYLTALETGQYNAATVIQDAPVEVKLGNGQTWKPQNIEQDFHGPVPLVRALAQSLNLATVNLGLAVGLPKVAAEFTKLGLEKAPAQNPSLLLGGIDLTPLEVTQIYNTVADGGFRTPLRAVRTVIDDKGKPLKSFPIEATQVIEPDAVYQLDRMLVQVVERGTARAARAILPASTVVAGKTGTSSDYRDSWFAGFSGQHLAVVWVGYDDNKPTGLTGAAGALAVWSHLMAGISTTPWEGELPDSQREALIEFGTGLEVHAGCGDDTLQVPVPKNATVPVKLGCEENGNVIDRGIQGVGNWLKGIIH